VETVTPPPSATDRSWEPIDFRRPTKLSREQLRSLDLFHDTFARRLSNTLGAVVRTPLGVDIMRTSQVSWDEYVRSLPAVTTLFSVSVRPLQGEVLVEMDTSLSLALAARLLGGTGRPEPPRRPGDLEIPSLRRLGAVATDAIADALGEFVEVDAHLEAVDLNPQLLGLSAPTQMVLVLTYSVSVPGSGLTGDLGVVISLSTLTPMLERMLAHAAERAGAETDPSIMVGITHQLQVQLEAHLHSTTMSAGAVAGLAPGDVLVLDHRITQPATVSVAGTPVLRGHLGRRGSRLAISVSEHPFVDPPADAPSPMPAVADPAGPVTARGPHGPGQWSDDDAGLHPREHDARAADPSASAVHSLR
jgi:flagellar motor switch protein FliM